MANGDASADLLHSWNATFDGKSIQSTQGIGRILLWVGAAGMLGGMFFTPPWVITGLIAGIIGIILTRAPIGRLLVIPFGLIFSGWCLLTVLVASQRGQPGATGVPGHAYGWLAIPVVAAAATDPRWRRWGFRIAVLVCTAATVVAILQFTIGLGTGYIGIDPDGRRFFRGRGFTGLNLAYGFLCTLIAVLAAQPAATWGAGKAWSWIGRAVGLIGMGISGSRGAILAYTAGVGSTLASRGKRWVIIGAVVGAMAGGGMIAKLAWTNPDRLHRMLDGEDGRWGIWTTSTHLIVEHPLMGVGGRRAYSKAYNQAFNAAYAGVASPPFNKYATREGCPHAHNWLLALASEHGIPGALLHLTVVGSVLVVCWRRRSVAGNVPWQVAVGIAATGLIGGAFEPLPVQSVTGIGFNACLGLALGLALSSDSAKPAVQAAT